MPVRRTRSRRKRPCGRASSFAENGAPPSIIRMITGGISSRVMGAMACRRLMECSFGKALPGIIPCTVVLSVRPPAARTAAEKPTRLKA